MSPNAQALPSVDQVLQLDSTRELLSAYSREYVVGLIRQILQSQRENTLSGSGSAEAAIGDRGRMLCRVETELAERSERARRPSLRRAINATGVILHTGLGRAPLSAAAAAAIAPMSAGLPTSRRAWRNTILERVRARRAGGRGSCSMPSGFSIGATR